LLQKKGCGKGVQLARYGGGKSLSKKNHFIKKKKKRKEKGKKKQEEGRAPKKEQWERQGIPKNGVFSKKGGELRWGARDKLPGASW